MVPTTSSSLLLVAALALFGSANAYQSAQCWETESANGRFTVHNKVKTEACCNTEQRQTSEARYFSRGEHCGILAGRVSRAQIDVNAFQTCCTLQPHGKGYVDIDPMDCCTEPKSSVVAREDKVVQFQELTSRQKFTLSVGPKPEGPAPYRCESIRVNPNQWKAGDTLNLHEKVPCPASVAGKFEAAWFYDSRSGEENKLYWLGGTQTGWTSPSQDAIIPEVY